MKLESVFLLCEKYETGHDKSFMLLLYLWASKVSYFLHHRKTWKSMKLGCVKNMRPNTTKVSCFCCIFHQFNTTKWTKRKINRKFRVATEIGSTFFWFLTSYWAAEIVQNDYLSSARNFRSIEYHHALYLNFGTLVGFWPWVIGLKIEILGGFLHRHKISDK
jgi:hypothetical protein